MKRPRDPIKPQAAGSGKGAAPTKSPASAGRDRPAAGEIDVGDPPHGAELDRYDLAILGELQREARLTNTELASRIGISAAPTWRRVRWLEEQGYITGYRAEIDRRKIGLGVLAFVRVDADRHSAASTRELEDAIRDLPEVVACHYISGSGTFELQVMATDLDAFSSFARDVLLNLPHVKDLHTSFSLGEVKAGGGLPLGHLGGGTRR